MKKKALLSLINKLVESQVKKTMKKTVNQQVRKLVVEVIKKHHNVLRKKILSEVHQLIVNNSDGGDGKITYSDDPVLNSALKKQEMRDNSRSLSSSVTDIANKDDDRTIDSIKQKIREAQQMAIDDNSSNKQDGSGGSSPINESSLGGMNFNPSHYGPGSTQHSNSENVASNIANEVPNVDPESEISPRAAKALEGGNDYFKKLTSNAKEISDLSKQKKGGNANVNWSMGNSGN